MLEGIRLGEERTPICRFKDVCRSFVVAGLFVWGLVGWQVKVVAEECTWLDKGQVDSSLSAKKAASRKTAR